MQIALAAFFPHPNTLLRVALWLILLIGSAELATGQSLIFADSISVRRADGSPFAQPWAGGLNSAQFGAIDLDGDGVKDLIVLERTANLPMAFLAKDGAYRHAPDWTYRLPQLSVWFSLADFDCDGDLDIFGYRLNQIAIWENQPEGGQAQFRLSRERVKTKSTSFTFDLKINTTDYPIIADLDGDGDVDLVKTADNTRDHLELHRNFSMERLGRCDSMLFEKVQGKWGGMEECAVCQSFIFSEAEICPAAVEHLGGSTLLATDLDDDGVKDLIYAEEGCQGTFFFPNRRESLEARFDTALLFDRGDMFFPAAFADDFTFDGQPDLIFSPFAFDGGDTVNFSQSVRLLEQQNGQFQVSNPAFLQGDMLDFGEYAYPLFADVDRDGDQDLLVGNGGRMDLSSGDTLTRGSLALLTNEGTDAAPAYQLTDPDWQGLSAMRVRHIKAQLADLNQDGRQDLIFSAFPIDSAVSKIYYILNQSNDHLEFDAENRRIIPITINPLDDIHPIDIDGDNNIDLLRGRNFDGALWLYKNLGDFNFTFDKALGGLGKAFDQKAINFTIADWDNDGAQDVVALSFDGILRVYPDLLATLHDETWIPQTEWLQLPEATNLAPTRLGRDASPAVFDNQLVVGMIGGGLTRFVTDAKFERVENRDASLLVYPNPASDQVRFLSRASGELLLSNTLGEVIHRQTLQAGVPSVISLGGLPAGVYLACLKTANQLISQRWTVIR